MHLDSNKFTPPSSSNSLPITPEKKNSIANEDIVLYSPPPSAIQQCPKTSSSSSSMNNNIHHRYHSDQQQTDQITVDLITDGKKWNNSEEYPIKDSNGYPIPQSFNDLIELVRMEMGVYGLQDPELNVEKVQTIIQNYKSCPEEWKSFAFFDKYRYTRNLVDDGNGKYNLLLLCWGPHMASPVHDHAGSHCILKVMDGELNETLFDWPGTSYSKVSSISCEGDDINSESGCSMKQTKMTLMKTDEAGYMHDKIGIHRVSNPSDTVPAVSLHLYSPPISSCLTFSEDGTARRAGNCVFYSVRGKKSNSCFAGLSDSE